MHETVTGHRRKVLGKIREASFGLIGYDDFQVGFHFVLGGDGWSTGATWAGGWAHEEPPSGAAWTHDERIKSLGEQAWQVVVVLLKQAKVKSLADLCGKPVEVTFVDDKLVEWRILKEVL